MASKKHPRKLAFVLGAVMVVGMIPMATVNAEVPIVEDEEGMIGDICGQVYEGSSQEGNGLESLVIARNITEDPEISNLIVHHDEDLDDDGHYCIENLEVGTYEILAFPVPVDDGDLPDVDLPGKQIVEHEKTCIDEEFDEDDPEDTCDEWELSTEVNIAAGSWITV